ncbi:MAG: class I SAM-dependent methyltransferase [Desulfobacterales bacterium]|nr:class I SAM-dependent methyltransferase [Desulfobacterales bacterium]
MTSHTQGDLTLDLKWTRNRVAHTEHYFCPGFNFWRDLFPDTPLYDFLKDPSSTPSSHVLIPGQGMPLRHEKKIYTLSWDNLRRGAPTMHAGRFYPQGLLKGIPDVYPETLLPFRCLETSPHGFVADLNAPMADVTATLDIAVRTLDPGSMDRERGGQVKDWLRRLMDGPGIQSRYQDRPTQFTDPPGLKRRDESADSLFYDRERRVHHLDANARRRLSLFYQELVTPGPHVLDLMAGWDSHLPPDMGLAQVHGVGLNAGEMEANPALTGHTVQDLNQNPTLEFKAHAFDLALCSLSVEYLLDPVALFREVARVLRPGGTFALAVSNRWFPDKAIGLWADLHDFERMGYILECFHLSRAFHQLTTLSQRGYPRPEDDPHAPGISLSDPLYIVTGKTKE